MLSKAELWELLLHGSIACFTTNYKMKLLTKFGFTLETSTYFSVRDSYQFAGDYVSWSDKKLFEYTIEQTKKYCGIDLAKCLRHAKMQQSTDQRYLIYACVYELPT